MKKENFRRTKIACYLGFVTQAIMANFAPLLFLKFHNDYKKGIEVTLLDFLVLIPIQFGFLKR